MTVVETITAFNRLAIDLQALRAFNVACGNSRITVKTDGAGSYWAEFNVWDTESGIKSTRSIPLNISMLNDAQTEMATLGAIIQNAGVVP